MRSLKMRQAFIFQLISVFGLLLKDYNGGWGYSFPTFHRDVSQLQPEVGKNTQICGLAASFPEASKVHRHANPGYSEFTSAWTGCLLTLCSARWNRGKALGIPKAQDTEVDTWSCHPTNSREIACRVDEWKLMENILTFPLFISFTRQFINSKRQVEFSRVNPTNRCVTLD